MSVVTYHEVSGNNVFDRLKAEGVIHEGDIFSPRRGEYVHFKNVFDYTKCDKETLRELDDREAERTKLYEKELNNNSSLTNEQRAEKLARDKKCDYHLLPVYKAKNGGVAWMLNYWSDDLPSVAIGRRYPEEVFEYFQETEGNVDVHCKYKCDSDIEDLIGGNNND